MARWQLAALAPAQTHVVLVLGLLTVLILNDMNAVGYRQRSRLVLLVEALPQHSRKASPVVADLEAFGVTQYSGRLNTAIQIEYAQFGDRPLITDSARSLNRRCEFASGISRLHR